MVWQRLEECYGSPEVTEDALLRKLEEFPRLTIKDNVKLRELSDVRPIVEKFPFNLQ